MVSPAAVLSSNADSLSTVLVWTLLVGLAVLAIKLLTSKRLLGGSTSQPQSTLALSAKPVLSEAEARFFPSLESAVDGEYLVWPQLPLWTFIESRANNRGTALGFKNQINLKRVDFCLVDRHTRMVHMAIELDDRTHQRSRTQRRDAFVEDVLKQAGVPLGRIPGAAAYDPQVIRRQLGMDEARNVRKLAGAR